MIDYLIIHGAYGSPDENWLPWLAEKLRKQDKTVLVPQLPTPEGQNLENWTEIISEYDSEISDSTVIIGHSIAPAFITDYLILREKKVKGVIFAALFYAELGAAEFDDINRDFFCSDLNLSDLKDLTEFRHCLFSDNDPYVPEKLSRQFSEQIEAETQIIPGGGHLNAEAGFKEFEQIFELIMPFE